MTNITTTIIFFILVLFVLLLGFYAARWKAGDLDTLAEWGLGGRRFGTWITWFLIGGDIYTAYTFIAVPALMFGAGAIGFFAVPYTTVLYPILFLFFPKLWSVAHKHGYVTGPEFVRGRYGNRWLALAIGVTGIVATMPYIALQLDGMQYIIGALGLGTTGLGSHLPLILSFIVLAGFTYTSGLRAPAMISIVKDLLIYLTVIAAIIVIPAELGGFSAIFAKVPAAKVILAPPHGATGGTFSAYATLALGSAMALFLYPHSTTALLSSSGARVIKRNAALLPAYSILLGMLALMGFMAIAAGVSAMPQFAAGFKAYGNNFSVPALLMFAFPGWFVGVAFAAIAIGALVPAAIMSIASANIFTRDILREFFVRDISPKAESQGAKIFAILMIVAALFFIFALPQTYAIQLQLLGGMWIIQTFPAVAISLYTRFFNGWALLLGWAAGIGSATWLASLSGFKGAVYALHIGGFTFPCYIAVLTLVVNLIVSVLASFVLNAVASDRARDETVAADYV